MELTEPGPEYAPVPGEIQSFQAENNSVVPAKIIQSFQSDKRAGTTEKQFRQNDTDDDDWRFEIKRKKRTAGRENNGSTAKRGYYYWSIRIRKSDGASEYYGTLDILDQAHPERMQKYWKRSAKRKVGKNARSGR